jgi:hypothetical protein
LARPPSTTTRPVWQQDRFSAFQDDQSSGFFPMG